MRCRGCDAEVGILDARCGACGHDLSRVDVRPRAQKRIPTFRDRTREPATDADLAPGRAGLRSAVFARVRASEVEIDADALDVVNLGLLANDIPLVASLRVRNAGSEPLEDARLRVWVAPAIGEPWERTLPGLDPQECFEVHDVTPPLDLRSLASRREAERAHLRIELCEEGEVVFAASQPVRILAGNEWIFLPGREWTLASFVFPNHPSVERVLSLARAHLEHAGFGGSFDGYQSGEREKVRAMAGALHDALACDLRLGYVNPPASFERTGQKIFLPAEIERHRRGTCLDLSLLFAAALERAGLAPLVVLVPGHAFVAVWTAEPPARAPVFRDKDLLLGSVARDGLLPLEATGCAQGASAALAVAAAAQHLKRLPLVAAIDVAAAREHGALPVALPEDAP